MTDAASVEHLWSQYGERPGVSPELAPLICEFYIALIATPVQAPTIKVAAERVLTFLASPNGKTDANCTAVDHFLSFDGPDVSGLPTPLSDVIRDMAGQLHDTVSAPEVALNFESTPEQLLVRLRAIGDIGV